MTGRKHALLRLWTITLLVGIFSTCALASAAPVFEIAPPSKAFLEYQGNAVHVRASQGEGGESKRLLGYSPSPVDLSHLNEVGYLSDIGHSLQRGSLPSKYDLRSAGYVTPVKLQPYNNCWAYSALGSIESTYLKSTGRTLDLSEYHLSWFAYNGTLPLTGAIASGGFDNTAVTTLARWVGPTLESDCPSSGTLSGSASDYASRLRLEHAFFLGLQFFAGEDSIYFQPTDEVKKRLVYEYGAISVGMYAETTDAAMDAYYNSNTHAWYYNVPGEYPNHAVLLVGWDDNFSRENFVESNRPARDGAWLIKNSWGTDFGDNGYFWISYDDYCFTDGVAYIAGETDNYDKNYGHDDLGWCSSAGGGSNVIWMSNTFTAGSANETLKAISFYTTSGNASYEISVYTGLSSRTAPTSGTRAHTQSGSQIFAGYHTIVLDEPVGLASGSNFAVVVKMTTPGYNSPAAVETAITGYSNNAVAGSGESFLSLDGSTWYDTATQLGNNLKANICIRAFTSIGGSPSDPTTPATSSDGGGGCNAGFGLIILAAGCCGIAIRARRSH